MAFPLIHIQKNRQGKIAPQTAGRFGGVVIRARRYFFGFSFFFFFFSLFLPLPCSLFAMVNSFRMKLRTGQVSQLNACGAVGTRANLQAFQLRDFSKL